MQQEGARTVRPSIQELQAQFVEITGFPLRRKTADVVTLISPDIAIGKVLNEISLKNISTIVFEGPPIYASPNPQRRAQQWDSPQFAEGWNFSNQFIASLATQRPDIKLRHWMLVDDVNINSVGAPPVEQPIMVNTTLGQIQKTLVNDLPIFSDVDHGFLESEFIRDPNNARCSTLDAGFQLKKIEDTIAEQDDHGFFILTVHPIEFRPQQILMFEQLLGGMKRSGLFRGMPKKQRREFIENTFRHVWISSEGKVLEVTQPQWEGNRFTFTSVKQDSIGSQDVTSNEVANEAPTVEIQQTQQPFRRKFSEILKKLFNK